MKPGGNKENGIVLPNGENRHVWPFKLLPNVNSFTQKASDHQAYKLEQCGDYCTLF